MSVATVANFAARGVLSVSASQGVDVASLIRESDVDERLLAEPGTRLPLDSVIKLWERARRTTGDEHLPLHVAEFLPFGAYKTYDLLLATAPTIGEALVKAAKFNGFVNDAFRPTLQHKRGQIIRATLNRASTYDELTVALRQSLNRLLALNGATLAAAARELGMSRRGLQRRLAARGMSFRGLFRSLRYELALTLLSRREVSLNETADVLGFSELSSFSRAFKRWTGMSPQAYRRKPRG